MKYNVMIKPYTAQSASIKYTLDAKVAQYKLRLERNNDNPDKINVCILSYNI